jgi:hypothetical protein
MKHMKPNIKPKSKIGKNKFEKTLINDPLISKKEIALFSSPKKGILDVSLDRQKKSVNQNNLKIKSILNDFFLKQLINRKTKRNNSQFLHTHITIKNSKRELFGIALPSKTDIVSLIENYKNYKYKYEIISVINVNTGRPIGYTVLKINKINISIEKFKELIEKQIISKKLKGTSYKKYLYILLSKIGIEIYFTPETGYKLDKNFNFVKE